jgi:anti-anti-sigma factor
MATVVKVFAGEYDLRHQAQLQTEFDTMRDEQNLILDLSAVTYLDSTFIGELIHLHNLRAERRCNRLIIVRPAPIVKKVLSLLYVFTFARVVATLDEALQADGERVIVNRACTGDMQAPRPSTRTVRTDVPTPAWISSVLTAVDF